MSRIPVGTLASGLPYTTPTNLTLSVSGPGKHGEVQTVTSTWDGDPAPVLTYQWQRDGVAISGATAATYTPVADDVGKALRVVVTGTNHMGPVAVISSAVTVAGRIDATGGIIRTSGGYTYHTFTSSSALTITTNTANRTLEYQVIGGGGGGGHSLVPKTGQECAGGGGGGGRFASGSFANVGTGNFTVTVGGGGSASGNQPNNGTGSAFHNSGSFGTGGGYGGAGYFTYLSPGSGNGGGNGGTGNQGNLETDYAAGGGGGSTGNGGNAFYNGGWYGGEGGTGSFSWTTAAGEVSSSSVCGGGGGGSGGTRPAGAGQYGGSNGSTGSASNATANRGGGGGGGGNVGNGGNGGSGRVVVRYLS